MERIRPANIYETGKARAVATPELWNPDEVDAKNDRASRFKRTHSPSAIPGTPATVSVGVWEQLVERFTKTREPFAPEWVELQVNQIVRVQQADGAIDYELRPREVWKAPPAHAPVRTDAKFRKLTLTGGALVDALLLGELPAGNVPDRDVWAAGVLHARDVEADGKVCLRLSQLIARFLGLRKGIIFPVERI